MKFTFTLLMTLIISTVLSSENAPLSGVMKINEKFECKTFDATGPYRSTCTRGVHYDFDLNQRIFYIRLKLSDDNRVPICTFNIIGLKHLPTNANIRILSNSYGSVYLTIPQLKGEIPAGTSFNYLCVLPVI